MKTKKCVECKNTFDIKEFIFVAKSGNKRIMRVCNSCRKQRNEWRAMRLAEVEQLKHLTCDVLSDFLRGGRVGVMMS